MMHNNVPARREARRNGYHTIPRGREPSPFDGRRRSNRPETLRQKDREGDEILESGVAR